MSFAQGVMLISYAAVSAWPLVIHAKGGDPTPAALVAGMTGVGLVMLDRALG